MAGALLMSAGGYIVYQTPAGHRCPRWHITANHVPRGNRVICLTFEQQVNFFRRIRRVAYWMPAVRAWNVDFYNPDTDIDPRTRPPAAVLEVAHNYLNGLDYVPSKESPCPGN